MFPINTVDTYCLILKGAWYMATIAYLRVSTGMQDTDNQKLAILEYGRKQNIHIDDFIEIEISSRQSTKKRRIDELMERLKAGDTLIITELSRLGRSIQEVVAMVNELTQRDVRILSIKQGIDIQSRTQDMQTKVMVTMFALFAELERDIISERTKMALASLKFRGVKLGKPVGTIQKSKLDGREDAIRHFLQHRVPIAAIARMLGVHRITLTDFINSRKLKLVNPYNLPHRHDTGEAVNLPI